MSLTDCSHGSTGSRSATPFRIGTGAISRRSGGKALPSRRSARFRYQAYLRGCCAVHRPQSMLSASGNRHFVVGSEMALE